MTTYPFSRDPTAAADDAAAYMREWYEANRESWIVRRLRRDDESDDFMISLLEEAERITTALRNRPDQPPPYDGSETKP